MTGKIAVVLGTRPEAIKLAPVIKLLKADPHFDCRICITAQHRLMLDQALHVFGLQATADLDLMTADQTLAGFASKAIDALDRYLRDTTPDLVLLQGDTTTVFCAALAAFYRGIPVAHVEAGLRTWDLQAPFPEEANRVLASRLATLHFAPTATSKENLIREGVSVDRIIVTGNTVIDALMIALERISTDPPPVSGIATEIIDDQTHPMVLITAHRRENFGVGFENICTAISLLAERFPATNFVYPVHLNPRVREPVDAILKSEARANLHLIEPVTYLPFVRLMKRAMLILTDSGGIQEEALSLGKPVLVMRDTTERPEGVACGAVRLVGTQVDRIVENVSMLLEDQQAYRLMVCRDNPYGDGKAASRIVEGCRRFLAS